MDVQHHDPLVVGHQELGIFANSHLVLHPDDLQLWVASDGNVESSNITSHDHPVK